MADNIDRSRLTQYLLGDASERERLELEESYFRKDDAFEQLLATEQELIDDYVSGELSDSDRERFEQNLLRTPEQRERVELSRALREMKARSAAGEAPGEWVSGRPALHASPQGVRVALAAAVLICLVAGGWYLIRRSLSAPTPEKAAQKSVSPREGGLQKGLDRPEHPAPPVPPAPIENAQQRGREERQESDRNPPRKESTVAVLLLPGQTREALEMPVVQIGRNVERVTLRLGLDSDEHRTYTAVLEEPAGRVLQTQKGLRSVAARSGRIVVMNLPARLLPGGDYVVTLRASAANGQSEDVGEYAFRLEKD